MTYVRRCKWIWTLLAHPTPPKQKRTKTHVRFSPRRHKQGHFHEQPSTKGKMFKTEQRKSKSIVAINSWRMIAWCTGQDWNWHTAPYLSVGIGTWCDLFGSIDIHCDIMWHYWPLGKSQRCPLPACGLWWSQRSWQNATWMCCVSVVTSILIKPSDSIWFEWSLLRDIKLLTECNLLKQSKMKLAWGLFCQLPINLAPYRAKSLSLRYWKMNLYAKR